MKRLLPLLFSCALIQQVSAQDTIICTNGERILAQVKSISSTEIEYKKFDNPQGPSYLRGKSETKAIHYKNGTEDVFNTSTAVSTPVNNAGSANTVATGSTSLTMSNVFSANKITFYGFDFSNCVLIEPKRMAEGQKIKDTNFPEWNMFFQKEVPAKTLSRWLKKSFVDYDNTVISKVNAQADPAKVVGSGPNYFNMEEKIKTAVAQYAAFDTPKEGIGLVVNMDYFFKAKEETSAYFTFFDMSTHAVIRTEHITVNKVSGAGLTTYWGNSLVEAMKVYIDRRYKRGY